LNGQQIPIVPPLQQEPTPQVQQPTPQQQPRQPLADPRLQGFFGGIHSPMPSNIVAVPAAPAAASLPTVHQGQRINLLSPQTTTFGNFSTPNRNPTGQPAVETVVSDEESSRGGPGANVSVMSMSSQSTLATTCSSGTGSRPAPLNLNGTNYGNFVPQDNFFTPAGGGGDSDGNGGGGYSAAV
jgi:hypothetical protein